MSGETFPLVTVVTPVLNGARTLEATLDSVRGQQQVRIEHVVVDGGSTDGTLDLLRARPDVVWTSGGDTGMYDAVNRGFERARGDVLAILNADDRYASPQSVGVAAAVLLAHPDVDVLYGDFRYVDDHGTVLETVASPPFDARRLRRYNFVPPHAAFVRRRVFHELGFRLDPSLRFAGDWEWFLRMAMAGRTFRHEPVVFSEFRRHPSSVTSTIGWRGKLAEWRRICRERGVSLTLLLLYEAVLVPLQRRWRRG